MSTRKCTKCLRPVVGHPRPTGANCTQEPLTEDEDEIESGSDIEEEDEELFEEANGGQYEEAELAAMEAELKKLQAEQRKLNLQRQLDELRQENAELRQTTSASSGGSSGNQRTQPPEGNMPSLEHLRQMAALNNQVDQLLFANETASAIAHPQQEEATGTSAGKKKDKEILMPEDFAHRPGQAELEFGNLSMQELVLGTVRIISSGRISPTEQTARLKHLAELMIHASSYKWPAVRAFYAVALREIKKGLRQWPDTLCDLRDEMLKPGDILSAKKTAGLQGPCVQWNYSQGGCPRGTDCEYRHICKDCERFRSREEKHRGRQCPHKPKKSGASGDKED